MSGIAVRLDSRPLAVVKAYWEEVVNIEQNAKILRPLVIEAVL